MAPPVNTLGTPPVGWTFNAGWAAMKDRFRNPANNKTLVDIVGQNPVADPPGPDYTGLLAGVPTGNPDYVQITAQDGPYAGAGDQGSAFVRANAAGVFFDTRQFLTAAGSRYDFTLFLLWRIDNGGGNRTLFPYASETWSATYSADNTGVGGVGINKILPGAGVTTGQANLNNHTLRVVQGPPGELGLTANIAFRIT
jgi:hypothetical protein